MTLGSVMFDLKGLELDDDERRLLRHPAAGGIILFSRNYQSPEQIERLVADIRAQRTPPLLVAVDQEGGRVQRFRQGFTELPPAAVFGKLYEKNPERARQAAQETGWLMAAELRARGLDFSFAPVLDLDTCKSQVIGNRAFAADPTVIGELAFAWTQGARQAGMASVGKHFPGHGCVEADSHHELPVDEREFASIFAQDLAPFRHLIENGLEGIMPAHVLYPRCDSQPAGFSTFWIKKILRERMGFQGVVFSDDLSMAGAHAAGSYAERAKLALTAGCDMVLVCNNPEGAAQVLDSLSSYHDPVAQVRLIHMHGQGHLTPSHLREDKRWHLALELVSQLEDHSSLDLEL